jgi:hypothetical protein
VEKLSRFYAVRNDGQFVNLVDGRGQVESQRKKKKLREDLQRLMLWKEQAVRQAKA